jgi:hypothetical protein
MIYLTLSHNEARLLKQLLGVIKEAERFDEQNGVVAADVNLVYKTVEQRLVGNVLNKIGELPEQKVINTSIIG